LLLAIVVKMKALEAACMPADQGRALYATLLQRVQLLDPPLAQTLHQENAPKPFTVSSLNGATVNRRGEALLHAGQEVWWRVTVLEPTLAHLLKERVAADLAGRPLMLGETPFQVGEITSDAQRHAWAGQTTCEDLVQSRLLRSRPPQGAIQVEFASPTTIHSQGKHLPFPLPELVFDSWLQRWNAFSPVGLPEQVKNFAQAGLAVSRFRLESRAVRYGSALTIGFVGECSFRLLVDDPYWQRLADTLAAYAFYCGTGHRTTVGLGQTRRIE
jgi:CRISPR-associated endoribonuclease Cas6